MIVEMRLCFAESFSMLHTTGRRAEEEPYMFIYEFLTALMLKPETVVMLIALEFNVCLQFGMRYSFKFQIRRSRLETVCQKCTCMRSSNAKGRACGSGNLATSLIFLLRRDFQVMRKYNAHRNFAHCLTAVH